MADKIDPGFVEGLRDLFATGEVRFITATDADPRYGEVFTQMVGKEAERLNADADEVRTVLRAHETAGKPFGLFLRTFELEAYQYRKGSTETDPEERIVLTANQVGAVEEHLHQALQHRIPFVAIRNQSALLANGLIPRFGATDEQWEAWVADLASKASMIVMDCFALSPGVLKELAILVRGGRQDATIIVISEDDRALRTDLAAMEGLATTAFERPAPDHPALAHFSRVAHERDVQWSQVETSPLFADLVAAAMKQAGGDLSSLPPPHRLRVLSQQIRDLRTAGELESAAALAAEAISIATALGDPNYLAATRLSAGLVALLRAPPADRARLADALGHFQVSGKLFNQTGNKEGEGTAATWAGITLKRGGDHDAAVMMLLIGLQRAYERDVHSDMVGILREIAPLLGVISPQRRQHPGVLRAAELIEKLGLGGTGDTTNR